MPGPDPGGVLVTILIGVVGAFVGAWILDRLGFSSGMGEISLGSIFTATAGAVVLLVVYRLITRRLA